MREVRAEREVTGVCEHDVSMLVSPPDEDGWQVVTCGECEKVLELIDSTVR